MAYVIPSLTEGMDKIITCLGNACFSEALIFAMNKITLVDHFSLVQLSGRKIKYITSANVSASAGISVSKTRQHLYLTHYYKFDPNLDYLNNTTLEETLLLERLQLKDIKNEDYQKLWCNELGIVDRISLLMKADKGVYCFNFYRHSTPFNEKDIDIFNTLAPILSALAVKHTRLAGSLSDFQTRETQIQDLISRLNQINVKLTTRELEVCARILLGMSSEGIALDLEIKTASVITYRKRAYLKLNISSQNSLFLLCLKGT